METSRYERPQLPANERLCLNCNDAVEDEEHLLFECKNYKNLRNNWALLLAKPENYDTLSTYYKLTIVLDSTNLKVTSQFIIDCFNLRYS